MCGYCRFSVVRSDRDLKAIGKIADLVPTASPIAVGDSGSIAGKGFTVLGRTQLDHGRGPWDEWYVSFADGTWGFLARAQGRFYLTFEKDNAALPPWDKMVPGARGVFQGTGSIEWVVSERGGSALLSAEGELPFPAIPLSSGRYVDLEAQGGAFATVDYGDGSEPPKLFAGRQLAGNELVLKHAALGPRPVESVEVKKLSCPSCGGPIAIFVPESTERCGCPSCGALLDHTRGNLALLQQLNPPKILPFIPLGSSGKLLGQTRTVIGFMQRFVLVDGERFDWREYLLYTQEAAPNNPAANGYTWLVEDNGHFMHVTPVSAAEVTDTFGSASFKGKSYKSFANGNPEVDFVIGEFYWKVHAGDRSQTRDYVAPPRILSMERTDGEISWSEGEYVEGKDLFRAFGLRDAPPKPVGVAPCQPNPHQLTLPAITFALLAALFLLVAGIYELGSDTRVMAETGVDQPPSNASIAAGAARPEPVFLPPFDIDRGPTTLKVELDTDISNGWVALSTSLLNETTGQLQELDLLAEHYSGFTDGESWSEGDNHSEDYYGELMPGRYVLRVAPSWDAWPESSLATPPAIKLRVAVGERSPLCCCGAFVLLLLPLGLTLVRRLGFEQKRQENSNL